MQETIEVTTPLTNKKVVIRGYQPAKLRQAVQAILLRGQELDVSKGQEQLAKGMKISGEKLGEITNITLKHMVLRVDEQTDNLLDVLGELPEEDFDFIIAEVDKAKGPLAKTS